MNRIDPSTPVTEVHYNLAHFNESSYYYDIGASTITFSEEKLCSGKNLVYVLVKPFLFIVSKFLNLFSYPVFLFKQPSHLTLKDLQGHTQDIYSGKAPTFKCDFQLLETENIKTVICFGNEEMPEEAKGLGLTYVNLQADLSAENMKKCAEFIAKRSRYGAKLYFFSKEPALIPLLIPHIRKEIPEDFRSYHREQELLSVLLD